MEALYVRVRECKNKQAIEKNCMG